MNPGLKTTTDGQFTTSGVGIGLTTAKNLVHSQCGEIYLESMPGMGTHVDFSVMTFPF